MTDVAYDLSCSNTPTVLLAHACPDVRWSVTQGLRSGKLAVEQAADGASAVGQLAARMLRLGRPFDGVVLHAALRGWSGLHILQGLRGSEWSAPTIFLVDAGDRRTAAAAARGGADVVIEWPADVSEVRAAVLEAVAGSRGSGVYPTPDRQ